MTETTAGREIVFTRVIHAPRELVFAAFTGRAHISNWWGPHGFSTTTHEMDVRPGGVWRFIMHGPDGTDYPNRVDYREVTRPTRLAYDHSGDGHLDEQKFQVTVTFDEREGKTFVTMRLLLATAAQREALVKFGAIEGGHQTLERLGQHLAEMAEDKGGRAAKKPDPEFVISRAFNAPRHLVWAAHSEADHLQHWWGPKGCTLSVPALDFRPGGLFHYCMRFTTGAGMWGRFLYREIVPQRRIVHHNSFSNADGGITRAPFGIAFPLEVLITSAFTERDGKTTLTLTGTPFGATDEEREVYAGMFSSMQNGFGGTYDQLEAYLKRG